MEKQIFDQLKELGVDVDGALNRFMGNTVLYEKFLYKFPDDPNMANLAEEIAAADYESALKSVHTLKGVAANLGLNPLADLSAKMLAEFRAGRSSEAASYLPELQKCYQTITSVLQ